MQHKGGEPVRKLTVKQRKFADDYIKTGNATQAAIKAGYSEKSAAVIASENLRKPYIKEYIDSTLDKISNSKIASAQEIMEYLTRIARGEERETIFKVVDGEKTSMEVEIDTRERIKAAELLGKTYSMFTDRKEVDVSSGVKLEDFFGDD